ncbi:MAG TPA: leucyl aminopeptidase family protein [Rhodocyclaceae bacterium]|nr:leucyl aminopeptidase family protein [Rhodocyclaceae bacterium]
MDPPRLLFMAWPAPRRMIEREQHLLVLFPAGRTVPQGIPARESLTAAMRRRRVTAIELSRSPVFVDLGTGARVAFAAVDETVPAFDTLTMLRKAAAPLLEEAPETVAVWISPQLGKTTLRQARFVLAANGMPLPTRRRKPTRSLRGIRLYAGQAPSGPDAVDALVRGNHLCRELTSLPGNDLSPARYRRRIRHLAASVGWEHEELDLRRLRKLGAGAFCAVAQGSPEGDAAIVRVSYSPARSRQRIALVGKGICHDTGGHNLKPAKYMAGMHEDMNGSAVALGLLLAVTKARLPVAVDCWLAIARNDISPAGFRQNDVITALDGTSIEIVHTDAEGRLVLADALALACRGGGRGRRPDLVIDFATLTGSMHAALGTRYSGVFASTDELAGEAVSAGIASGERVCVFPMDADYEAALESKVADIKQCAMEGDADHILAACFLRRFVGKTPWLHMDLSASRCPGGLGAIAGDLTGFGVGWGLAFIASRGGRR